MHLNKHRNMIILLIDIFILIMACTVLFYVFPQNSGAGSSHFIFLIPHLLLLIICETIPQYLCRNYNRLWRYAESIEFLLMLFSGFIGYIVFIILDHLLFERQLMILFSLTACSIYQLGMIILRLCYRHYQSVFSHKYKKRMKSRKDIITLAIIGAGEAGVKLYEVLSGNPDSKYNILFFIDDSVDKIGKRIRNIPVKGPISKLDKILSDCPVHEIIITIPKIPVSIQKEILDTCLKRKCRVQILPSTLDYLQNAGDNDLWKNIRDINIEELLGRDPIVLDNKEVESFIRHKTVMVTGGGGSIGSELCRQIAKANPKKLLIVDIYENNAYDIQQELKQLYQDKLNLKVEIASVSDKDKIYHLIEQYRPNIVFHAAAHKHVPLMEDCPEEAIKNNILGTYYMVLASEKYKVEKFILISTDKAVNPTSIMGASKRFCEMILQSRQKCSTEFAAVRFGNVLGSNGSVIPLFKKQIAMGGPVTITDKRIVRYFMTISEAVQLVLQAGAMASSSEIYVLDMGEPVKILDLAENMIRLSGYVPYKDIPIIEVGLRPGEKLYEELLMKSEELVATTNQKIFIERQKHISRLEINFKIKSLTSALNSHSPKKMKQMLKKAVSTYIDPEEVNTPIHQSSHENNITK